MTFYFVIRHRTCLRSRNFGCLDKEVSVIAHLTVPAVECGGCLDKKCIELAYEAADLTVPAVTAHEVRAVANSLLYHVGAPLNTVCAGGRWRSTNSFFNHYLRSMHGTQAGSSRLVVAAGKLIQS